MARCTGAACPAQIYEHMKHFVSRGAMDIRGVGQSLIASLLEQELVKDVSDLYYLKEEQIVVLERMAAKSAENAIDSIEKSKGRPFARLLFAFCIRHVGNETAEILARRFGSIDRLANASEDELKQARGIGRSLAKTIYCTFNTEFEKYQK